MFGELEVHPFRPEGEFPEIMVLDNHKDNPVLSTDVWHTDTTFRECPTKYSILRCIEIPKTGGATPRYSSSSRPAGRWWSWREGRA